MGTDGPSRRPQLHSPDAELPWPGRRSRRHEDERAMHPATPVDDRGASIALHDDPVVIDGPLPQQHAGGVDELPGDNGGVLAPSPEVDITSLDLGGDVVFVTDRNGVIVDVNDAFVRVTGYPRAEAIGSSPRLLSSGLQDQAFYATLWRTILDGRVWEGQLVDRRRDGSLRTHRVTITPVKDRAGRVTHFVAVERDITAELGRQIVHGSTGLLHTDVGGRCVYADGRAAELLGRTATRLLGDGLLGALVPEDADALREAIALAVERGRVHRLEVRTVDGGWLRIEAAPLPVASGNVIGATCSVEDVADRLASRREHDRRDAMVASVLDTFTDPIAVVQQDGTIATANVAWRLVGELSPDHPVATTRIADDLIGHLRERAEDGDDAARAVEEDVRRVLTGLGTPREGGGVLVRPLRWDEGGAIVRIEGLVGPDDLAAAGQGGPDPAPEPDGSGADAIDLLVAGPDPDLGPEPGPDPDPVTGSETIIELDD